MAIVQISKIQVRTGDIVDLPVLSEGEFGYATDDKLLYIGNPGSALPSDNTEVLTENSDIPAPGSDTQVVYNNSGILGAEPGFTYNYISNILSVPNTNITTEATMASAIVSDLTAGRVTFAGTSGALVDDGDFTYNSSTNTISVPNANVTTEATMASAIVSDLTAGRVTFAGVSGALVDSADLTFNDTTNILSVNGDVNPQADATHDLGTSSLRWDVLYVTDISTGANSNAGTITGAWTLTSGSTLEATYSADVAEYYTSDEQYEPGTVLAIGGAKEVTITNSENYKKLAGVVSTSPAYKLNTAISNEGACIALVGRVPVKVIGKITKGDLLRTSKDHPGVATVEGDGVVLGRALSDYDSNEIGKIEVKIINN